MAARAFSGGVRVPRIGIGELAGRILFITLLAAAPLLPKLTCSSSSFPAVTNWWVCLPFCGLFLLALLDVRHPRRIYNLDLVVLGSLVVAFGCFERARVLPMLMLYPPLIYLAVRMLVLARVGRAAETPKTAAFRPWLPWPWLAIGIVVLSVVHVQWALDYRATADVGEASVQRATRIVHGEALYGAERTGIAKAPDAHYDTYGPFNYEAYVPFTAIASSTIAAHLASLFFSLLTAGLLFVLGRRVRGPTIGAALAFAWLAFPFTLYVDAFAFNDGLVAATLTGTLLVIGAPLRRGAMIALAGWTKLSPLALVPVMIAQRASAEENRPRAVMTFAAGFVVTSAVIFVPALDHNSLSTFIMRSFGYQASRLPQFSIWSVYGNGYRYAAWIVSASEIVRGLLTAITLGFGLALLHLPRRQDVVGLAGASASVLIALEICDGYYWFSYLLWFAPLVLVALTLDPQPAQKHHNHNSNRTSATDPSGYWLKHQVPV